MKKILNYRDKKSFKPKLKCENEIVCVSFLIMEYVLVTLVALNQSTSKN